MAHWLHRLLNPQSIAIVGASARVKSLAAITHQQLLESGYTGDVYSVNPKYQTLYGQSCYASLNDLPAVPDLVIYAISGLALEQSFGEAMVLKVGGVVIYAANYIANDRMPKLPERLRQKARQAAIPVCGGNSMGFYNFRDPLQTPTGQSKGRQRRRKDSGQSRWRSGRRPVEATGRRQEVLKPHVSEIGETHY